VDATRSSTAAALPEGIVEDNPWLHLDIAGTAWIDDNKSWIAKGPSGIAVRSLWNCEALKTQLARKQWQLALGRALN